jgi:uncharacterized Fe-S center protein
MKGKTKTVVTALVCAVLILSGAAYVLRGAELNTSAAVAVPADRPDETAGAARVSAARVSAARVSAARGTADMAISLRVGDPAMTVNGAKEPIDENGTVPVIRDGRTLLPARAVVEAMGGAAAWDSAAQTVTLTRGGDVVRMVIGSATLHLNGVPRTMDVAPVIIGGRTMLPIRFIAENFGCDVGWDGAAQTVTLTQPGARPSESDEGEPSVYMTVDISAEGMMRVYEALGVTPSGNVAVKITTGEPPNSNYLRPELIKDVVRAVDGTLVESNTAYGGSRASTALHRQVAEDHGYTAIAEVDILDADGSVSLPVTGGKNLTENFVGANFEDYDFFVVLSHFKGHQMAGFGGAVKNISIGIASSEGKSWIHTAGKSKRNIWGGEQNLFLESMAEAGKSVVDSLGGNILYINVMNRLSVDCDCNGNPAEPDMHDIGILASLDPVALDQACLDLVYAAPDGDALIARMESRNGVHTLEHGEAIGLGSRRYNLVSIK